MRWPTSIHAAWRFEVALQGDHASVPPKNFGSYRIRFHGEGEG